MKIQAENLWNFNRLLNLPFIGEIFIDENGVFETDDVLGASLLSLGVPFKELIESQLSDDTKEKDSIELDSEKVEVTDVSVDENLESSESSVDSDTIINVKSSKEDETIVEEKISKKGKKSTK